MNARLSRRLLLQVFMKWREGQKDKRAEEQAGVEAERRRKGNLTGREIFAEASIPVVGAWFMAAKHQVEGAGDR